jgi:hypothetical protein
MANVPWRPCRYSNAERGHVLWWQTDVDEETWTCFHHARTHGAHMVSVGWARVTEEEWLHEDNRLKGAL